MRTSAIRRWWGALSDLWNLRMHGWVEPSFSPEIMDQAAPPAFLDDGATRESPKYIILYRGELSPKAATAVADVLDELRSGGLNRFQANAELYDIAVELKQPILFWATTYERYSGAVLEWND